MMEDKQMRQYSFFSKIGAFSINLENSKASLQSLRYAVESLQRNNASLFLYPEGKITPASEQEPKFKEGLAWLYAKTDVVDFVPAATYIHTLRSSKPELYISIGEKINYDKTLSRKALTKLYQEEIHRLIKEIRDVAGFSDKGFSPQF